MVGRQLQCLMPLGRRSDVDVVRRQTDFIFLTVTLQLCKLLSLATVGTKFVILDSVVLNIAILLTIATVMYVTLGRIADIRIRSDIV